MAENFEMGAAPYLVIDGVAKALEFYQTVFNAEITGEMMAEDGKRYMHASMLVNGSLVMMSDAFPEFGNYPVPSGDGKTSVAIALRYKSADEVDRIYRLALDNGGTENQAPVDMFWGDRFAHVTDISGHRWMLAAPLQQS